MKNDLIWAYFYQLSLHMWDDAGAPSRGWYLDAHYDPENGCDPELWDEMVEFLKERRFNTCVIDVGDGVRYESHPEISAPDAWSKEYLADKLSKMREAGITPIPKLNFSACHDTWLHEYARQISTPAYYKMRENVIREVWELFDSPALFHLGMDEEDAGNQIYRSMTVIRSQELWWHDNQLLFDLCEKLGTRPWVWSDVFWHFPEEFKKHMPKSVLQSNWFYDVIRDYPAGRWEQRAIDAYFRLDEMGYDQIPSCSTWDRNSVNTFQTMALGKDKLSPEHLKGYMTIPWSGNKREHEYVLKNDAHQFWLARKKVYPETL